MILSDRDIRLELEKGRIEIDPFDPDCVQAFLRREKEFMEIREMYPENIAIPEGKPFELPARDRA